MNLMTITTKNPRAKKYAVSVDMSALERIASSLGLFQPKFLQDISESIKDMKNQKFAKIKSLKDLR